MDTISLNVKVIFILIDGVGDLSQLKFENKTILQSIPFPNFNIISSTGFSGIMDPVETGLACGSDTAHMNIFGYNPFKEYRGRGSFETIGSGIPMSNDEIGFKCNFAYMDPNTKIVEKRRVDRSFPEWGIPLIDSIHGMKINGFEEYKLYCVHATEHRCAIKISGQNLSSRITSTDPLKDNQKLKIVYPKNNDDKKAVMTAKLINNLSDQIHEVLKKEQINLNRMKENKLPANIILLRGCGSKLKVKNFYEMHGFRSFMIAPTAIINGLGQSLGMEPIKVDGATGDYHSNFIAKADSLLENIRKENYDFGFLHIKAVDDAGHDKSLDLKIKYLKKVDEMCGYIYQNLSKNKPQNEEYIICLTGDHTTPIKIGDHTFEPVPFSLSTHFAITNSLNNLKSNSKLLNFKDSVESFNEIDASEGILGRFSGTEVLGIIKRFKKMIEII